MLPVQDEVGLLRLAAANQLAAHDDAALGERHLTPDLRGFVPPDLDDGRGDELDADVVFAQVVVRRAAHHLLQLGEVLFPELQRPALAARAAFVLGLAQLHAADLAGDGFRQLGKLDAAHALVGAEPAAQEAQDR